MTRQPFAHYHTLPEERTPGVVNSLPDFDHNNALGPLKGYVRISEAIVIID